MADMNRGILWGVKASLLAYTRRMGGPTTITAPAQALGDEFFFPYIETLRQPNPPVTLLRFAGSVIIEGHGGLLRLPVTDPTVVFREGRTDLEVSNPSDPTTRIILAHLNPPLTPGLISCTLAAAGSQLLLGSYPNGTELDPLHLRM